MNEDGRTERTERQALDRDATMSGTGEEAAFRAVETRQGAINLRSPGRRAIFIGGLVLVVVVIGVLAFL